MGGRGGLSPAPRNQAPTTKLQGGSADRLESVLHGLNIPPDEAGLLG